MSTASSLHFPAAELSGAADSSQMLGPCTPFNGRGFVSSNPHTDNSGSVGWGIAKYGGDLWKVIVTFPVSRICPCDVLPVVDDSRHRRRK
jgi:hypothetical protein